MLSIQRQLTGAALLPVSYGPEHQENTSDSSIANSNYDPLETTPWYDRHGCCSA
jgi:hypothetical protein